MRGEIKLSPASLTCGPKCVGDLSRREMLRRATNGFGLLALHALLAEQSRAEEKSPGELRGGLHFPARAKRVVFLFMDGGVSHVDSFDPKPVLDQRDGQKVGDWKPFRFTSEGSNVTSGTKPNLPNGVSLHCWKPKSVAQFVGADSGDGLTVGLTNLNDETSSQFLAQLEYDLDVKLVTGKRYAVRVDYRTVNEGAGNVTLQSEEYSIVQTTPLEATAGAWQTKDALFSRQEGKPIRIAINSTGIGEGNTLGIRRVTVFEVP